jgi:hypothetical protein
MSSRDAMFPSAESYTHESTEVQYYGTVRGMGRRALLPPFRAIRVVKKRLFGRYERNIILHRHVHSGLEKRHCLNRPNGQ